MSGCLIATLRLKVPAMVEGGGGREGGYDFEARNVALWLVSWSRGLDSARVKMSQ